MACHKTQVTKGIWGTLHLTPQDNEAEKGTKQHLNLLAHRGKRGCHLE